MREGTDVQRDGRTEALESGSSDGLGLLLIARKFAEENGGDTWKGKDLCRDR